jgi:hypothetical protein
VATNRSTAEGNWPGGTLPARCNTQIEIELALLQEEWLADDADAIAKRRSRSA